MSPVESPLPESDERLLRCLAQTLVAAREAAGESQETVAGRADVRAHTIQRVENAENWPKRGTLDRVIDAYAAGAGVAAADIWQTAAEQLRWLDSQGSKPPARSAQAAQKRAVAALRAQVERVRSP